MIRDFLVAPTRGGFFGSLEAIVSLTQTIDLINLWLLLQVVGSIFDHCGILNCGPRAMTSLLKDLFGFPR